MFMFAYLLSGSKLMKGEYELFSPSNFKVSYNVSAVIREISLGCDLKIHRKK